MPDKHEVHVEQHQHDIICSNATYLRRHAKRMHVQPLENVIQRVTVQGTDVNTVCQGNTLQRVVLRKSISTPRFIYFAHAHGHAAGNLRPGFSNS